MLRPQIDQNCILRKPILNEDKIESLEDCKKVLSFLCAHVLPPLPENIEYTGFSEVRKYFK